MTDRPLEDVVSGWYRQRAAAEPVPGRLRARVLALPDQASLGLRPLVLGWRPRSAVLVVAVLAALLLALAVTVAGMAPRLFAERSVVFNASLDACTVIRAAVGPGIREPYLDGDHGTTSWGAHVCVHDGWDGSYVDRHLFLRGQPTTSAEALALIDDQSNWSIPEEGRGEFADPLPAIWTRVSTGVWAGIAAADAPRGVGLNALAVAREPYFFIVTGRWESQVIQDAQLVAGVLGVDLGEVPLSDWHALPVPTMWRP